MENNLLKLDHLTLENRQLLELINKRDLTRIFEPELILPILRPCRVRVLLVADGLDFSMGDFGLRTFVETLRTMPGWYVRFDITVAHIFNVSDDAVMVGHPGITRSIKQFKFDDPAHFTPTMYDQVWLFGIATFYNRGNSPGGQPYPNDRLGNAELRALSEFMDGGGGLFATGDHGALGVCLSGAVPRARSMRLWGDTSANNNTNEVSMTGPRRNDTNRIGSSPGSQFNDQSDDVPQTIAPKMYQSWTGLWRYSYPHPLLCSPRGVIRVLPDHPHEGQCVEPTNTARSDTFAGYTIVEYPAGTGGNPRPLPEVIATSSVLAGTTSGGKQPTQAHTFGAIGAYDGHRASVGRVVTDATWHHFVNVNLVGDPSAGAADPKRLGFLASAAGQAHLEEIKTYYRNIAVWMARPAQITCMRNRICWGLVWHDRVMEAVLTNPVLRLRDSKLPILYYIGQHARDALGFYAGQCQSRRLALDLITLVLDPRFVLPFDPWAPIPEKRPPRLEPDPLPWINLDPMLDSVVGGALVALREKFPQPSLRDKASDEALAEAIQRGVEAAVSESFRSMSEATKQLGSLSVRPKRQGTRRTKRAKRKR